MAAPADPNALVPVRTFFLQDWVNQSIPEDELFAYESAPIVHLDDAEELSTIFWVKIALSVGGVAFIIIGAIAGSARLNPGFIDAFYKSNLGLWSERTFMFLGVACFGGFSIILIYEAFETLDLSVDNPPSADKVQREAQLKKIYKENEEFRRIFPTNNLKKHFRCFAKDDICDLAQINARLSALATQVRDLETRQQAFTRLMRRSTELRQKQAIFNEHLPQSMQMTHDQKRDFKMQTNLIRGVCGHLYEVRKGMISLIDQYKIELVKYCLSNDNNAVIPNADLLVKLQHLDGLIQHCTQRITNLQDRLKSYYDFVGPIFNIPEVVIQAAKDNSEAQG